MSNLRKLSEYSCLALLIALAIFVNGCALGVTRADVAHEPLTAIKNKKDGDILVMQFVDKRKDTQYIGYKRNMFGMRLGRIGTKEGVKLNVLLTEYFAEALREAGYNAVIEGPQSVHVEGEGSYDAVLEGEILEFWLDLYMATWHKVAVLVKAMDVDTREVLWQKEIRGEEKNVLWLGVTSEFEMVISQALTKALNQAASEFASDEFYMSIKK
jgi:hypothetical protein